MGMWKSRRGFGLGGRLAPEFASFVVVASRPKEPKRTKRRFSSIKGRHGAVRLVTFRLRLLGFAGPKASARCLVECEGDESSIFNAVRNRREPDTTGEERPAGTGTFQAVVSSPSLIGGRLTWATPEPFGPERFQPSEAGAWGDSRRDGDREQARGESRG